MSQILPVLLGCRTCRVVEQVPLDEPEGLTAVARAFFLAHADCETSIDLDGEPLRGWAVRLPT